MKRATVLSCRKSFRLVHSGGLLGEDREPAYSLADNLRSVFFFTLFFFYFIFFKIILFREEGPADFRLPIGHLTMQL